MKTDNSKTNKVKVKLDLIVDDTFGDWEQLVPGKEIMKGVIVEQMTILRADAKDEKPTTIQRKSSTIRKYGNEYDSTNGWHEVGDNTVMPNINM